jgi:hypothetical protein
MPSQSEYLDKQLFQSNLVKTTQRYWTRASTLHTHSIGSVFDFVDELPKQPSARTEWTNEVCGCEIVASGSPVQGHLQKSLAIAGQGRQGNEGTPKVDPSYVENFCTYAAKGTIEKKEGKPDECPLAAVTHDVKLRLVLRHPRWTAWSTDSLHQ